VLNARGVNPPQPVECCSPAHIHYSRYQKASKPVSRCDAAGRAGIVGRVGAGTGGRADIGTATRIGGRNSMP
jgi:hypothetical protein